MVTMMAEMSEQHQSRFMPSTLAPRTGYAREHGWIITSPFSKVLTFCVRNGDNAVFDCLVYSDNRDHRCLGTRISAGRSRHYTNKQLIGRVRDERFRQEVQVAHRRSCADLSSCETN
ncbi:hypothetical protein Y1Q_0016329 [Alligator mississippiensis]|uniref:Uncharacterized protein n=1 Tax=Alligator mississippiensis TaxID=8496 RepID=A0A151N2E3_ALLMI|nr:hypothetical protein Y1Q_0016329 [Alligator mississippiensis]